MQLVSAQNNNVSFELQTQMDRVSTTKSATKLSGGMMSETARSNAFASWGPAGGTLQITFNPDGGGGEVFNAMFAHERIPGTELVFPKSRSSTNFQMFGFNVACRKHKAPTTISHRLRVIVLQPLPPPTPSD